MAGRRANGEDSIYKSGDRWYKAGYVNGTRHKVSRKTRAEAVKAFDALKKQLLAGVRPQGQPKNLSALLDHWYEMKEPSLRYRTAVNYRRAIVAHIGPTLGRKRLGDISPADIERWQHSLLTERSLAPSTVRAAKIVLRQALDSAVRHGDLAFNPVDRTHGLPKGGTKVDPLTLEESRHLLQSVADDPQARLRLLLALSLGLRQGEVLALKWDSVELASARPTLTVRASLQRQTGKGLVLVEPKTEKSRRTIGLAPVHVEAFKALRAAQNKTRLALGNSDWNPDGFVFTTAAGSPMDPANDRKRWLRWLSQAGLKPVRVHSARHTAVTLLLAGGVDLPTIQQIAGHSSIRTTVDIYGHLSPAVGTEAVSAIAESLTA